MNPMVEGGLKLARDSLEVVDQHFHRELHKEDCRELIRECAAFVDRLLGRSYEPDGPCEHCGRMTHWPKCCDDCQDRLDRDIRNP